MAEKRRPRTAAEAATRWKPGQSGNPAGRETHYTPELAEEICNRIASGKSILGVADDPDMPCANTIRAWRKAHPEFAAAILEAANDRLEVSRDKLMDLADQVMKPNGPDPMRVNAAAHAIVKAEGLANRPRLELTGRNGGPIETKDVSDLDAARAVAFLLASAARNAPGSS